MLDIPLHVGLDHPSLWWVGGFSLLSFAAGIGIGLRARADRDSSETTVENPE